MCYCSIKNQTVNHFAFQLAHRQKHHILICQNSQNSEVEFISECQVFKLKSDILTERDQQQQQHFCRTNKYVNFEQWEKDLKDNI